ncbi:hypothetical protein SUGI_0685850 [Cryptomeria japonica]|nr:hypothetical protein SUGI_0685850 [Cryptomeria japonica]
MAGREQKPSAGDGWGDIQGELHPSHKSEILRYADFARVCYSVIKNDEIDKDRRPIGFIAVCTDENEIRRLGQRDVVVAFRGTSRRGEWTQNLKDKVVPWRALPGKSSKPVVGICKGFLGYYEEKGEYERDLSPKDIIGRTIKSLLEKYKGQRLRITVTGHSLGGALATMSAYHIKRLLKEIGEPSIPVTAFTFASPRVGNRAFANHIEEIGVKVLRVVVKHDLVTKVPGVLLNENAHNPVARLERQKFLGQWAYCHVGRKIQLDPSSSCDLRLFQRHHIETYFHLLARYTKCSS